jgi:TatD DNase family protein
MLQTFPREQLLLETDCPYLAPEPGQSSEPADVARTAAYAAELWQCTPADVMEQNAATFRTLFRTE